MPEPVLISLYCATMTGMILKRRKAQIAIFFVLLLHMFFVFFALVINVGLLIYQKINLQNAVDLAAYYGAMKQAENLNAIAHLNYQIRQSWKLLTFRYRTYGFSGVRSDTQNPNFFGSPLQCYGYPNACAFSMPTQLNLNNNPYEHFDPQCAIAFCASHSAWNHIGSIDSYESLCNLNCHNPNGSGSIPLIPVPNAMGFGGALFAIAVPTIYQQVVNASQVLRSRQISICQRALHQNFLALSSIIFSWRYDMITRKALILAISQSMSRDTNDFLDLTGQSVRLGVENTLRNNLTPSNLDGLQIEFYNSLGHENCRHNDGIFDPPQWLNPVEITPVFRILDMDCGGNNAITKRYEAYETVFNTRYQTLPNELAGFNQLFDLYRFNLEPPPEAPQAQKFLRSILGFEKNPWCVAYVAVKAQTRPRIPFLPFRQPVTLKASAFAKPFGGRMGPWYYRQWPKGSHQSGGAQNNLPVTLKTESGSPPRGVFSVNDLMTAYGPRAHDYVIPNYSPAVGGLQSVTAGSIVMMTNWLKAFFRISLGLGNRLSWNAIMELTRSAINSADHLLGDGNTTDAWRQLEINVVLPDQFDVTHYSIEMNFLKNYGSKLRINTAVLNQARIILNQSAPFVVTDPQFLVRGDLGYNAQNISDFDIDNQYQVVNGPNGMGVNLNTSGVSPPTPPMGFLTVRPNPDIMPPLTLWHMEKPGNYTLQDNRFGQCLTRTPAANVRFETSTPNNCVSGGRSGYSVKLVHPDWFAQPHDLGLNSNPATILNPPPPQF